MIKEEDIETELRPLLARFAKERNSGERFGDWCQRIFLKEQTN
jgi:sulfite reductase (NADPH) hemoprotein beta-component